ncbi:MAG TPA: hypothetical protein VHI52_22190, partial [Verrucomicrobiae bacterium]|nr:hypothetical protein [Verrucomicrobiae bacterium]
AGGGRGHRVPRDCDPWAWGVWREEVGEGEELGGGEAGGGGVVGAGEFEEAGDGGLGVVLGDELELLGEEGGAELAVGLVLLGEEEGFGFFFGELEGVEDVVELCGGGGEVVEDWAEGAGAFGGGSGGEVGGFGHRRGVG